MIEYIHIYIDKQNKAKSIMTSEEIKKVAYYLAEIQKVRIRNECNN
jgi:hypothetical protein